MLSKPSALWHYNLQHYFVNPCLHSAIILAAGHTQCTQVRWQNKLATFAQMLTLLANNILFIYLQIVGFLHITTVNLHTMLEVYKGVNVLSKSVHVLWNICWLVTHLSCGPWVDTLTNLILKINIINLSTVTQLHSWIAVTRYFPGLTSSPSIILEIGMWTHLEQFHAN